MCWKILPLIYTFYIPLIGQNKQEIIDYNIALLPVEVHILQGPFLALVPKYGSQSRSIRNTLWVMYVYVQHNNCANETQRLETSSWCRAHKIPSVLHWTEGPKASANNEDRTKIFKLQAMDNWHCGQHEFMSTSKSRWYVNFRLFFFVACSNSCQKCVRTHLLNERTAHIVKLSLLSQIRKKSHNFALFHWGVVEWMPEGITRISPSLPGNLSKDSSMYHTSKIKACQVTSGPVEYD